MRVARMEFQLATTANLLSLLREPSRVLCLGWPGSGFAKLVREPLSKNAMLPGLTYFYCNWVSQGGNVVRAPSDAPLVRAFLCPALQSAGSAYADHILQSSVLGSFPPSLGFFERYQIYSVVLEPTALSNQPASFPLLTVGGPRKLKHGADDLSRVSDGLPASMAHKSIHPAKHVRSAKLTFGYILSPECEM
jgi:hypothetical protein